MDKFDLFTESEYNQRKEKLETKLNQDLSIIFNRPDLFHYSGTGLDGMLVVNRRDDSITRYTQRNIELARTESVFNTSVMSSFRVFKELANSMPKPETIGLELDLIPYRTVDYILKAFDFPKLVDIGTNLRVLRSVKSPKEQEYMKQACKQTDESFEYIRDKIKPGMTELEISADLEYFLRKEGHPGFINVRTFHHNLSTLAMVMSGESTATLNTKFGPFSGAGVCKLHKIGPSRRKLKEHDQLVIDTTGVVEGYTADETRTFFVGTQPEVISDGYTALKQIHEYVEKNMVSGVNPPDLFAAIWQIAGEFGIKSSFMGRNETDIVAFVGHGVGLELDEFPIITDKYERPLQKGNIVAMEPKLVFDSPRTGIGIEDTYIVGDHKAERITLTPW